MTTPSVVLLGYPPVLTWLGGYHTWVAPLAGYPLAGPGRVPPPAGPGRVPPQLDLAGYPPSGWTWQGTPPVSAPWHSGKCCKALWDMGTPPCGQTEGQTHVKTLPSRRTTYAGGNIKQQRSYGKRDKKGRSKLLLSIVLFSCQNNDEFHQWHLLLLLSMLRIFIFFSDRFMNINISQFSKTDLKYLMFI